MAGRFWKNCFGGKGSSKETRKLSSLLWTLGLVFGITNSIVEWFRQYKANKNGNEEGIGAKRRNTWSCTDSKDLPPSTSLD